jgi:hypothetical protein
VILRSTDVRGALKAKQRGFIVDPFRFGAAAPNNDLIRLRFEGANNSQTFTDEGTAGSVWTPSQALAPTISTAQFVEGASAFNEGGGGEYITTPYVAGNAITSGEFFIGAWIRCTGTFASRYLFGVEDAGGTAAGSGWFFYSASSNRVFFFYSDGSTRASINKATGQSANTFFYVACERVSNTLYLSVGGTVVATVGFSGSLNLPGSASLRVGATPAGTGPDGMQVDMLQVRRASVYGGANFTPPTTAIP